MVYGRIPQIQIVSCPVLLDNSGEYKNGKTTVKAMKKQTKYERLLTDLSRLAGTEITGGTLNVTLPDGTTQVCIDYADGTSQYFTGRDAAALQKMADEHERGK